MKTRSPTEFDQNNRDVTSIPGKVIKKNSSRGSEARTLLKTKKDVFSRRDRCLKRPDREQHGRHPKIRSRWYADEEYRKSLSAAGWKEHLIMLYDRIAAEKHI